MLLFFYKAIPLLWVLFGGIEVITFFYFLNNLSKKWRNIPEKLLLKKIFSTALLIRIIYVLFSYFFYLLMTGKPFEFGSADAEFYHDIACSVSDVGFKEWLNYSLNTGFQISDMGHPLYLGFVYMIFGKYIIIPRLISSVLSAWMVVLLFKFSKRNFGELAARNTAIIAILLPNLIFYCGLHLKETNMIFLVTLFLERSDYVIRSEKIRVNDLIIPVLVGVSLFLFRTVLGASVWFAFFSALVFSKTKTSGWGKRIILIFWFVIAALFIFSGSIEQEIDTYWQAREANQSVSMQFRAEREGGNSFAKYGSAALFAPAIFVAPFPTMVNVETQQNQMSQNGTYIIKNIMAYFVFIGLFAIIFRYKTYRHHVLLLVFIISYLLIISMSAFALSERFHLPTLPFLMVLAGFGLTQVTRRQKNLYVPYLVLIAIAVIGWNIFKLVGRGAL